MAIKQNKLFVVVSIREKTKVRINKCEPPLEEDIDLSWADGMIGILPVFDSRKHAKKYGGDAQILEIERK